MPADRLNLTRLETAVLSVVTGQPPGPVAARLGLSTAELTDAADTFHNAGRAALQHRADGRWQAYVEFPDWTIAETTAAPHLAPVLDRGGAPWSFIRKHPHWRLRLHSGDADHHELAAALDALAASGHIRRWHPGIYEPETAAFGGRHAMGAIHELFHTDSRSILTLPPTPALGRRELSMLLCTCLLRGAGLEWYEQGDVWQRATTDRPLPKDATAPQVQTLTASIRELLTADLHPTGTLFGPGCPAEHASAWANAFRITGRTLGAASRDGTLNRGLRQVLAYIVIFHWNRLGLAGRTQSLLAHAARTAILGP
ncbi:thiopeptide-type bacteriocin biosynthesis protein [Streptomyces bohaiensis]|uniref:thiopeptide-type bacteriocin biosynthesis protein n=1 Tax=Streptomyces bohaiensis TaxID=1431344 RepID=UPI003B7F1285